MPDEPFSHENVKGAILKELVATHPLLQKMNKEIKISLSMIGIGVIGVAGVGLYVICSRASSIQSFFSSLCNK